MATMTDNRLGETLRFYRQQRGWTTTDLASWVGICRQYLSAIELGKSIPESQTAAGICATLGLSSSQTTDVLRDVQAARHRDFMSRLAKERIWAQRHFDLNRDTKLGIPKSYVED